MNPSKIHSIEDGVHELRFGESWDSQACVDYHALQYSFKPQSASRIGTGTLQLDNNMYTLCSGQGDGLASGAQFQGQCTPAQLGQDCIAIFEDNCWRLELVSGVATNMRHVPASGSGLGSTNLDTDPRLSNQAPSHGAPDQHLGRDRTASGQPSQPRSGVQSLTPSISPQPSTTTASQELPSSLNQAASTVPSEQKQEFSSPRKKSPGHNGAVPHLPGGQSPSVAPQAADLERLSSESTETSSSGSEPNTQPQHPHAQEAAGTRSNPAEVPDFEREFFQENSDDESESASSDSSGDQSEEEAKHF